MRRRLNVPSAVLALALAAVPLRPALSLGATPASKDQTSLPPNGETGDQAPPRHGKEAPPPQAPGEGGPGKEPHPPAKKPAPKPPGKKKPPARPPRKEVPPPKTPPAHPSPLPTPGVPPPQPSLPPAAAAPATPAEPPPAPAAAPVPAAATLQELANGRSVKGAALAALLRLQDRLKRAADLEQQALAVSTLERTTGALGDQLRLMAAELGFNVPEVGSAAIEADRLRRLARSLPDGASRREVRQSAFDLQQLADQMQGQLDKEKAAAGRLSALAGPAP